ncbi:MAG: thioredoxin family protein [Planctomycetes bacterium]|nr:thioredoxin family protein [Planctomycetota bacterium]
MRITTCALLLAATLVRADDKEALRAALKDTEPRGDWIYDDLARGFAEARRTRKPLMVVFRCVP